MLRDYQRTTPIRPMVAGKRRRTWEKKPPEKVWFEMGGYITEEKTPPGNYRMVRYTKEEPEAHSPGWYQNQLRRNARGGDSVHGTQTGTWARNLAGHGSFAPELELKDISELPVGYELGEWKYELFKKGYKPYSW